jgi:hypothetical protein
MKMQFNGLIFSNEIIKSFQILGQEAKESDVIFITETIEKDVNQYKTLSFTELISVINLGCRNKLCDFMGLNVATIHKWIKFYLESDLKKQFNKEKLKPLELPELSDSEKDRIFKDWIIATLSKDNIEEYNLPIIYDYLSNLGIIDIKIGAVKYIKEAKEKIKTGLYDKKDKCASLNDFRLRKEISNQIVDLLNEYYDMNLVKRNAKIIYMRKADYSSIIKQIKK